MSTGALTANLLKCKISIWTPAGPGTPRSMICEVFSHKTKPSGFMRIVNSNDFGNSLLNPYRLFQIRFRSDIKPQMLISDSQEWFKIRQVEECDSRRSLSLLAIKIPALPDESI